MRKGAWSGEEDSLLRRCVEKYGEGNWHLVPGRAGLQRCRRSCRQRWLNYLSPNVKRGMFSTEEEDLIIRMQRIFGNRWSLIAGRMAGRTANDVKNHWNTRLAKRDAAKPAAGPELPAAPPARIVVHRPKAHRVSERTRELLRRMYSRPWGRSPNPSRPSQPLDGAKMADGLLADAPEPSISNLPSISSLPWLSGEDEFMQGGEGDWLLDAAQLDSLFCDSSLWDWTKDGDGSSPLR
ncbi:unnamed protein product [Victoria cruziana]